MSVFSVPQIGKGIMREEEAVVFSATSNIDFWLSSLSDLRIGRGLLSLPRETRRGNGVNAVPKNRNGMMHQSICLGNSENALFRISVDLDQSGASKP